MRRSEKLTRSQTLMAANAPVLVRKAMIEGDPVEGVLDVAGGVREVRRRIELEGRRHIGQGHSAAGVSGV